MAGTPIEDPEWIHGDIEGPTNYFRQVNGTLTTSPLLCTLYPNECTVITGVCFAYALVCFAAFIYVARRDKEVLTRKEEPSNADLSFRMWLVVRAQPPSEHHAFS